MGKIIQTLDGWHKLILARFGVVQSIGRFFSERDVDHDLRPLADRRLNIEQTVDKFASFPEINHTQAGLYVLGFVDCLCIEADPVILDLEQGDFLLE